MRIPTEGCLRSTCPLGEMLTTLFARNKRLHNLGFWTKCVEATK